MRRCSTGWSSPTTASPRACIFCRRDPAASVGWKLVAVNLSDLAAKGATPAAALLSLTIGEATHWDDGLPRRGRGGVRDLWPGADRRRHDRLAGGCAAGVRADRDRPAPAMCSAVRAAEPRRATCCGCVGTLGDSAAGLALLMQDPAPRGWPWSKSIGDPSRSSAAGQALAPHANAMMDVSDGLLLDAHAAWPRRAAAAPTIELDALPLSRLSSRSGATSLDARLFAATGGDDYALLAALPAKTRPVKTFFTQGNDHPLHRDSRR